MNFGDPAPRRWRLDRQPERCAEFETAASQWRRRRGANDYAQHYRKRIQSRERCVERPVELNILVKDPNPQRAVDGYIADALCLCRHAQDGVYNGILDGDELFTYTAGDGSFRSRLGGRTVGSSSASTLGGHNTIDVLTGLAFHGTLRAPSGSTVMTPLTTLIVAIAATRSATTAEAEDVPQNSVRAVGHGRSARHLIQSPARFRLLPVRPRFSPQSIQVQATVRPALGRHGCVERCSDRCARPGRHRQYQRPAAWTWASPRRLARWHRP